MTEDPASVLVAVDGYTYGEVTPESVGGLRDAAYGSMLGFSMAPEDPSGRSSVARTVSDEQGQVGYVLVVPVDPLVGSLCGTEVHSDRYERVLARGGSEVTRQGELFLTSTHDSTEAPRQVVWLRGYSLVVHVLGTDDARLLGFAEALAEANEARAPANVDTLEEAWVAGSTGAGSGSITLVDLYVGRPVRVVWQAEQADRLVIEADPGQGRTPQRHETTDSAGTWDLGPLEGRYSFRFTTSGSYEYLRVEELMTCASLTRKEQETAAIQEELMSEHQRELPTPAPPPTPPPPPRGPAFAPPAPPYEPPEPQGPEF